MPPGNQGNEVTARALLDRFTSVDDLLRDEVRPALEAVRSNQRELASAVGAMQGGGAGDQPFVDEYPYGMSHNVPPNTTETDPDTVEVEIKVPFEIDDMILGWEAGANNLTGFQLGTIDGDTLVPRNDPTDYLTANDFMDTYRLRRRYEKGTTLIARFVNNDTTVAAGGGGSHKITAIPFIKELS